LHQPIAVMAIACFELRAVGSEDAWAFMAAAVLGGSHEFLVRGSPEWRLWSVVHAASESLPST
jgi:hypothetical protein